MNKEIMRFMDLLYVSVLCMVLCSLNVSLSVLCWVFFVTQFVVRDCHTHYLEVFEHVNHEGKLCNV